MRVGGGDVAAPIAALVAERYIKGRTDAKHLANRLMNASYLPPIGGITVYKKPAPVAPVPLKKDSTRRREKPIIPTPKPLPAKPLITVIQHPKPLEAGTENK